MIFISVMFFEKLREDRDIDLKELELIIKDTKARHPEWTLNNRVYDQIKADKMLFSNCFEESECEIVDIKIEEARGDCIIELECPYEIEFNSKRFPESFKAIGKMKSISCRYKEIQDTEEKDYAIEEDEEDEEIDCNYTIEYRVTYGSLFYLPS